MKKTLMLAVAVLSVGLFACNKKCAECSVKENNYYNGEYCRGDSSQNLIYDDAKEECEYLGGQFK